MARPSGAWRAVERKVCALFNMLRTPLSGGNGGAGTRGDCYGRRDLYIEVKHGARWAIETLYQDTLTKAEAEGKTPICVVHKTGSRTYLAVVDAAFLASLLRKETIIDESAG